MSEARCGELEEECEELKTQLEDQSEDACTLMDCVRERYELLVMSQEETITKAGIGMEQLKHDAQVISFAGHLSISPLTVLSSGGALKSEHGARAGG